MKIAFFEISPEEQYFFAQNLFLEATYHFQPLQETNIADLYDTEIISIFIHSKIDKEIVQKLTNIKLIITRSTGFDHIDMQAAQEKNIIVRSLSEYATQSVAEFTLMLILLLARKFPALINAKKHTSIRGFTIENKKLGVIGVGRIGKEVIKRARCNNMQVLAHDIHKDESYAQSMGFSYVDLYELYAHCDIITLHLPLHSSTKHLITHEDLKKIRPGTLLINTARGDLIENEVLIEGLTKNIFSALALDVLPEEYATKDVQTHGYVDTINEKKLKVIITNMYLMEHPRVIITHHSAYNTEESARNSLHETLAIIEEWKRQHHEI